jgi:hypothetical protein
MVWLFTRVAGKDSTATIHFLALYVLYFSIHDKAVFDWEKIISCKISFSIIKFQEEQEVLHVVILNLCYHILPCFQKTTFIQIGQLQD